MADDRIVTMSASGYKSLINSTNGKGLHWTTEVHSELPIKVRPSGAGSERPLTVPQFFLNQVKTSGDRNALHVERGGKALSWTWNQYYRESLNFAKAMHKLQISERSAVAIMGFNSPEWAFSFIGAQFYNSVVTGIYTTNAADACHY
jgi:long-chain-fatty-acid--CoA ligase ACSBG